LIFEVLSRNYIDPIQEIMDNDVVEITFQDSHEKPIIQISDEKDIIVYLSCIRAKSYRYRRDMCTGYAYNKNGEIILVSILCEFLYGYGGCRSGMVIHTKNNQVRYHNHFHGHVWGGGSTMFMNDDLMLLFIEYVNKNSIDISELKNLSKW